MGRYVCARCFASQGWVPPLTLYLVTVVAFFSPGSDALGTGVVSAIILLPISAWMSTTALNVDDTSQIAVVSTSMGSYLKGRVATVLTTALVCGFVGAIDGSIAFLVDPKHGGPAGLLEGVGILAVANTMTIASGATLGLICARPIIRRPGYSWLFAVLASVVAFIIPGSPLASIVSVMSASNPKPAWVEIATMLVETLAVASLAFTLGLRAARRLAN